jgi:serine phosphatase RsbU (regulator of sigma subunit)/Tfp pilus assembly protein PilF
MLLRRYFILFYVFFVRLCCFSQSGQNKSVDSLQTILLTQKEDTIRVKTLNKLGGKLKNAGNYEKALKYLKESLSISEKENFRKGKIGSYVLLGNIYQLKSDYPEALKNYFLVLKIFEEVGDKRGIASTYNNIGIVYNKQKNYKDALKNFFSSLEIKKEIGNKDGIAYAYTNIGVTYCEQQNFSDAMKYYALALKLDTEAGNKESIASDYNNIAIVLEKQNKLKEALEKYKLALAIREETGDKYGIANSNINLGTLYLTFKKTEEAKKCLNKALSLSLEMGAINEIKYCYGGLLALDSLQGNFKQALADHKLFILYRDSVFNEENSKKSMRLEMNYEFDKKEVEIRAISKAENEKLQLKANEDKKRQNIIICSVAVGLFLVSFFLFFVFRSLQQNKKANKIISAQKKEVENQKHIVDEKQKEIVDSINYAKRIQYSLLPDNALLEENCPDHFVLFKPKDIVSGDFYWATSVRSSGSGVQSSVGVNSEQRTSNSELFYLAVCDSTGHGVPGAFMSLLNIGFMSEAIKEKGIERPDKVFNYIRERLALAISKEGQKDGFDGILLCFDKNKNTITYSAANNSPVIIENGAFKTLEVDKMPVGIGEKKESFNLYNVPVKKGQMLYLYTDGFADQFGGIKGKKFMSKQLNNLLAQNSSLPSKEQKDLLNTAFENWKGSLEQIDDVCIIGIRI